MTKLEVTKYESVLLASNMYIIKFENKALIIDPWNSNKAITYLKANNLCVDYIILTHEHYDHISGVNSFKEEFDCEVLCNRECSESIQHPNLNLSKYFDILLDVFPAEKKNKEPIKVEPYSCLADTIFDKYKSMKWQGYSLELTSTPGHSKGSICILLDNEFLFSGDSLLKDYPTITRLKGGSSKSYKGDTMKFLRSLSPHTIVYPGHYESFVLKEALHLIE